MSLLKRKQTYDTKVIGKHLREFMDMCDGADAVIVSTVDGHMIDKVERNTYPVGRIATMGSSMMSLADTMTAELKMGRCNNLILENETGILLMMHINPELVLVSITHSTNKLGMLISSSRVCSDSIHQALT
jgi:predicted regulator of Ras-like GTPase activity (Roadblock/LC7/MglB family)